MDLVSVVASSGGAGMIYRIILMILGMIVDAKKNRDRAINSKLSDGKTSGIDSSMDKDSLHTANDIGRGMFWIFAFIMVTFTIFPNAQIQRFIPEAVHTNSIELLIFSYAWSSDLANAIVITSSGDIVIIGMGLITFCLTAFFRPSKQST